MSKSALLDKFKRVERIACGSRLKRFLAVPFRYLFAISFRTIYRLTGKPLLKKTKLFFGVPFYVNLPAGTDIFITGGKSDDAELRLAKFLIKTLKQDDIFLDIGAHFGYFSLLAKECTGNGGRIYSFEGSKRNCAILEKNVKDTAGIYIFNNIVGRTNGVGEIYEFPAVHSEYNTIYPQQYEKQSWYKKSAGVVSKVESITMDSFCAKEKIPSAIVKIDAEGAEYDILLGADIFLSSQGTVIIMEFLSEERSNENHRHAAAFLKQKGYGLFVINQHGHLLDCADPGTWLRENRMSSDNLVFKK
jgi:FkbM family methyltransferase